MAIPGGGGGLTQNGDWGEAGDEDDEEERAKCEKRERAPASHVRHDASHLKRATQKQVSQWHVHLSVSIYMGILFP